MVAALVAVGAFATSAVRRAWPQTTGTIALEGLGSTVSVVRDERGIPTISADNATDLFRAQGFVSAQDRFFEMDLRRQPLQVHGREQVVGTQTDAGQPVLVDHGQAGQVDVQPP